MKQLLTVAVMVVCVLVAVFYFGGYHIVWSPTENQLFGCDLANTDPTSDECK